MIQVEMNKMAHKRRFRTASARPFAPLVITFMTSDSAPALRKPTIIQGFRYVCALSLSWQNNEMVALRTDAS